MGEANDWCRLHGLALQLSVLPSLSSPHAVTCLRTQDSPLPSRTPLLPPLPYQLTRNVFIFLYVHRLTTVVRDVRSLITGLIGERIHHYSSTSRRVGEFYYFCHKIVNIYAIVMSHYYCSDSILLEYMYTRSRKSRRATLQVAKAS